MITNSSFIPLTPPQPRFTLSACFLCLVIPDRLPTFLFNRIILYHTAHTYTISHVLKLMSFSSHLIPRVLPPRYLWISSISHRHQRRWFGPGPGLLCVMSEGGTDAHWRGTIRCHLPIRVQRFLLALGQHIFGVLRS